MTQKLSHKDDADFEFKEMTLDKLASGTASSSSFEPGKVSSTAAPVFAVSDSFWDNLSSDPELREEFESRISVLADRRMQSSLLTEKAKAIEEGRKEGIERGIREAKASFAAAELKLSDACQSVLDQKAKLMGDHQVLWMESFSRLLERFLVPNRKVALEYIDSWISKGVGEFEKAGKVNLYLSPVDHKLLVEETKSAHPHWEVLEDIKLAPGEVRCECDRGGMVFSPNEQLKELETWIARFAQPGETT